MLKIERALNIADFQKFLSIIDKAENGARSAFSIIECAPRCWKNSENLCGFNLTIKVKTQTVMKEYEKKGLLEIITRV